MLTDEVVDPEGDTPPEEIPEWMHEDLEVARKVQEDTEHRYLELPGKFDIHDWDIVACFTSTVKDEHVHGIRGSGAFRAFKHLVAEHNLGEAWNKFHDARLREIAIEWCEDNNLAWREK